MAQKLTSLQAVRAVAALLVVAFHLQVYFLPDVFGRSDTFWRGFFAGYAGVEIFFVLSGFIMVLVHRGDFGRPMLAKPFLMKRILRIYPFYWLALAAIIAGRSLAYGTDYAVPDLATLFRSLALLPGDGVLGVAWSLSFEMLFYLIFSLAILNLTLGKIAVVVWFGATVLTLIAGWESSAAGFLLSPYNLLFLFGIIAAGLYGQLGSCSALSLLSLGATLFAFVGLSEAYGLLRLDEGLRTVLFGLGATGIVAGLAALERLGRLSAPSVLVFLGDASYAIYLLHMFMMTFASKTLLFFGLSEHLSTSALFLLLLAFGTASGALAHLLVEKPLLQALKGRRRPAPKPA